MIGRDEDMQSDYRDTVTERSDVVLQEPADDGASPAYSVSENPAYDQEGSKTSRPSTASSREDNGSAKQGQIRK